MKTNYSIDISYNVIICKHLRKSAAKSVIKKILLAHGVSQAEISLAVVDKAQILEVNKQYLNSETETDVIAFDFDNPEAVETELSPENELEKPSETILANDTDIHSKIFDPEILANHKIIKESIDGEIIINAELAIRIAADFNHTPRQELLLYIIHGLLHIIGYDDIEPADKKIMWAFQQYYLDLFTKKK